MHIVQYNIHLYKLCTVGTPVNYSDTETTGLQILGFDRDNFVLLGLCLIFFLFVSDIYIVQ